MDQKRRADGRRVGGLQEELKSKKCGMDKLLRVYQNAYDRYAGLAEEE
ncbi:hypothetical protein AALB53_09215 [Lachnospiraceae bacterium 47-T17]